MLSEISLKRFEYLKYLFQCMFLSSKCTHKHTENSPPLRKHWIEKKFNTNKGTDERFT